MSPHPRLLLGVLMVSAALYQPRAEAILGIGDVSFDPTAYSELVSIYEQTKQLFDTAREQLNNLARIQDTITQANQAYESLVNLDIKKIASDLRPQGTNGSENRFKALSGELSRVQSKAGGDLSYVQYQAQRLKNLESLDLLQSASTSNTERASTRTNAATSAQITAQSTSALTALAASEEQRRVQEEIALAQGRQHEVQNLHDSRDLYEAIGMRKPPAP